MMPTQKNSPYTHRIKQLQTQLTHRSHAILVSHPGDVAYYAGFQILIPEEREAVLVVTKKKSYLIKQSFSPFSRSGISSLNGCTPEKLFAHCRELQIKHQLTTLFFDCGSLTVSEYDYLKKLNWQLKAYDRDQTWQSRMVKDQFEIDNLKKACKITKQALRKVIKQLKVGITEQEVKQQFLLEVIKAGGQEGFPTIVCFGDHGALPHHQPSDTKLTKETPILTKPDLKASSYDVLGREKAVIKEVFITKSKLHIYFVNVGAGCNK